MIYILTIFTTLHIPAVIHPPYSLPYIIGCSSVDCAGFYNAVVIYSAEWNGLNALTF